MDLTTLINSFPARFGLRGFPGEVFRLSTSSSYLTHNSTPPFTLFAMLYTQRQLKADDSRVLQSPSTYKAGDWLDFAKGTEAEMRREVVALPTDKENN